jgi:hypothetical protein
VCKTRKRKIKTYYGFVEIDGGKMDSGNLQECNKYNKK